MKKILITLSPILVILFLYVILDKAGNYVNEDKITTENYGNEVKKISFPANVQMILDKSCIGCHNTESKNNKGRMKLNFDKMTNGGYSVGKTSSKLRGVIKTLDEKKMPPNKFLIKYPERAISAEESKLLVDWAKEQEKALKN